MSNNPRDSSTPALVVVAFRADSQPGIWSRVDAILALSHRDHSLPSVFAKAADELTANDLDRLAEFIGWDGVRALNIGDVVNVDA